MKLVHACVSVVVLCSAVLLASCSGSYTDPLDGNEKTWQSSDDPTPEEAKRDYQELERQKGLVDTLLAALRAGPHTPTVRANIASCVDHLESIGKAKEKLEPHLR